MEVGGAPASPSKLKGRREYVGLPVEIDAQAQDVGRLAGRDSSLRTEIALDLLSAQPLGRSMQLTGLPADAVVRDDHGLRLGQMSLEGISGAS